jgi:hypothetical protein
MMAGFGRAMLLLPATHLRRALVLMNYRPRMGRRGASMTRTDYEINKGREAERTPYQGNNTASHCQ